MREKEIGRRYISDAQGIGSTRQMTKIIVILEDSRIPLLKTELCRAANSGVASKRPFKDSLHWLLCNKIILKCRNYRGQEAYIINPEFRKLRGEDHVAS